MKTQSHTIVGTCQNLGSSTNLVRQQSKREREKRSVSLFITIVLIDQAPSPNQTKYRSQLQSQIRDTPGVKLKETRVGT